MEVREIRELITVEARTKGVTETAQAARQLGDTVGKASNTNETLTRSSAGLERALDRTRRQLDMQYRVTQDMERAQRTLNQGLAAGQLSAAEYARQMQLLQQRTQASLAAMAGGAQGLTVSTNGLQQSLLRTANAIAVIDGPLGGVASRFSAMSTLIGRTGLVLGASGLAFAGLTMYTRSAISAFEDFERQQNITQTVLRATGGAAGRTAEQIEALSQSIGFDTLADTRSVRAAAAQLLTFRSVATDVFDDTLRLSQDLATVGFGSIESAAVTLGKALEDPERGLTALTRVGVSFSATQKQLITDMIASGRQVDAQREILKTVEAQVGGAGVGAAGGLAGAYDTLSEAVGRHMERTGQQISEYIRLAEAMQWIGSILRREANEAAESRTVGGQLRDVENRLAGSRNRMASYEDGSEFGRTRRALSQEDALQNDLLRQRADLLQQLDVQRKAADADYVRSLAVQKQTAKDRFDAAIKGIEDEIAATQRLAIENQTLDEIKKAGVSPDSRSALDVERRAEIAAKVAELYAFQLRAQATAMNEASAAQEQLNAVVARGEMTSGQATARLDREIEMRRLSAEAMKVEGEARERILASINELNAAYERETAAKAQSAGQSYVEQLRQQIAAVEAQTAALTMNHGERERMLALLNAETQIKQITSSMSDEARAAYEAEADAIRKVAEALGEAMARQAEQREGMREQEREEREQERERERRRQEEERERERAEQARQRAIESAQKMARSQQDEIDKLRLQIGLIGASARERNAAMAAMEAEQRIRDMGIDAYGREAEAIRRTARELAELRTSYEQASKAAESASKGKWGGHSGSARITTDGGDRNLLAKGQFGEGGYDLNPFVGGISMGINGARVNVGAFATPNAQGLLYQDAVNMYGRGAAPPDFSLLQDATRQLEKVVDSFAQTLRDQIRDTERVYSRIAAMEPPRPDPYEEKNPLVFYDVNRDRAFLTEQQQQLVALEDQLRQMRQADQHLREIRDLSRDNPARFAEALGAYLGNLTGGSAGLQQAKGGVYEALNQFSTQNAAMLQGMANWETLARRYGRDPNDEDLQKLVSSFYEQNLTARRVGGGSYVIQQDMNFARFSGGGSFVAGGPSGRDTPHVMGLFGGEHVNVVTPAQQKAAENSKQKPQVVHANTYNLAVTVARDDVNPSFDPESYAVAVANMAMRMIREAN
jgi:hypothetical protein